MIVVTNGMRDRTETVLTVREVLTLPVFATAKLVAGEGGLDNNVNWVHIVDIPDAHYEWDRRGVLLLTAGYGLWDDPDRQAALISQLVEKGFAGMVFSTGYYFDCAPPALRESADRLDFPLVETPPELLFIEVTETVLERIINRQYTVLQQAETIHGRLTQLVLQGGDLNHLAQTLARILERAVTIEDPAFRILASAREGTVDPARERSVANGQTTPEVAQRLLERGVYARLLEQMGPLQVDPMPDLGMTMQRIVAPVIVAHEIYGYIWIIAGDRPLTSLDELAIDHAATVAALILFKEQAVRRAEEALRGDFLGQLLQGKAPSAGFAEQARRLGYRPEEPHQALLIYGPVKSGGSSHSLQEEVERWLDQRLNPTAPERRPDTRLGPSDTRLSPADKRLSPADKLRRRPLLVWRDRYLVLLLESADAEKGQELARALVDDLSHPACRLLIGVGHARQPQNGSVARSFEEAQEALRVARAMGREEGVVSFADLGVLHWLYHLPEEVAEDNVFLQHIHALARYDAQREAELLKTLEAYLDCGGSLVEAAEALYVHRNTLLHRIERIEELRGLDLRDSLQRLNLHVALKHYRLHG